MLSKKASISNSYRAVVHCNYLNNKRYIVSDERRVKQIVLNLLSNAIKFTMYGGITVKSKIKGNDVYITVADTGMGIQPEDLPKLFKEFSTLNTHQSVNPNGTGLGLYLSRGLAQLMEGDISVKSIYGKGSKFKVRFASIMNSNLQTLKIPNPPLKSRQHIFKQCKKDTLVLIVDDNQINFYVLSGMLKRYCVNSDTAKNGKEAIEQVKNKANGKLVPKNYSLIFMDINMPIMSGIEVILA